MSTPPPPDQTRAADGSQATRPTGATPNRDTADMHSGEWARMRDADAELAVQLPDNLRAVRDLLVDHFGQDVETLGFRGELTLIVPPARMREVLQFCRDDEALSCEMLADLTCVHWPAGPRRENSQETTGWPTYEFEAPGHIDVDYILLSLRHGHRFRVRAAVDDADPRIDSAHDLWASAAWMECEAYDFFGVNFEGHPNLRRLHMPEDWNGHPQRKDYPLGGVDVDYKGALVPPPDRRKY